MSGARLSEAQPRSTIAATGPPPSGPWWAAETETKTAGSPVTAAVTGDPAVFVSVSAAHQGPDGGGPVAAIVDLG